MSSVNPPTGCN